MAVKTIRVIFVFACMLMGCIWANYMVQFYAEGTPEGVAVNSTPWVIVGGGIGAIVSIVVLIALRFITQELYERLAPALVAIVLAMIVGYLIGQYILFWAPNTDVTMRIFLLVSLVLVFGFAGISLGLTRASNWEVLVSAVERGQSDSPAMKLVDTSVIIDGRIADICASGFLEGVLLVPRFVLKELQNIADSSDVLRRAKGRRGLDILQALQDDAKAKVRIQIIEDNPKDVREVDGKLVVLAKKYQAKILTNDFNLNKVAQIEGVEVLNINDLANALKPVVLPDEEMEVRIIKEGKEPNQGVGYLDDGTMIVVDGGRAHMGKTVKTIVTSVLQTAAGRMIFTRFDQVIS